ncbi:MBL fold metallo-hydrolase [Tengunoibacter tsumagoiensis]|uniref:MBL fold metallo-hydrolase n=1 Tax=Tengunoibacter tsumagoiensis TaxID=2014871 RepID=A0A401ZU26_9CHLR|nr:MBL fold metallo-hydrolase [Tengunoibacter tsumagoiensis]GCE10399.1 MBL fold metallo-hydrolase [Tengunoibacter tsumagoiensis]
MVEVEHPRFQIRFWGVRGSYPTPGLHTVRHGGNTACVEVQAGQHTLIFDAGSGIIRLGEELMRRQQGQGLMQLALFITHGHGDHLQGFPFFAPLFAAETKVHLFGPQLGSRSIEELMTILMSPPYFPVDVRKLPSQRVFHTLTDEQSISWLNGSDEPGIYAYPPRKEIVGAGEVRVSTRFTTHHPTNGAILYRIEHAGKRIVYATDVEWNEGCEREILEFMEGADVLIHDAQYTKKDYQKVKHGFGHCTVEMAIEAAAAAHVKELILFHHEPTYDDDQLDAMEAEARGRFAQTRSAYEGMEIDLLA